MGIAPSPSCTVHPATSIARRTGDDMGANAGDGEGWPNALAKYEALASSLPSRKGLGSALYRRHGGFWYPEHLMAPTLAARGSFVARPSDVILATIPKSGTTWLKALSFSVVHRGRHAPGSPGHPLLGSSPHDLVPFLHSTYESRSAAVAPVDLLEAMPSPSPRILAVHTPLSSLPASVRESGCRVVYLCRDPKDAFVSLRHYLDEIKPEGSTMTPFAEAFELLCDGVSPFGPMWEHAAEYWKESLARPEQVMFLRYESLKEDGAGSVRTLAGFLGRPFTDDEVARGVPEAIVELCSMQRMRSVEANRDGKHGAATSWSFKNSAFFRKGEVGDWKEHMTEAMAQRLDGVVKEKLRGTGLSLSH
ncbi:cytosolic sulfotransferase 13-like [Oryza brachyantha]|uniref:cytosolic sulfotransferase 13-like n=1 Tax=Oryza brachyantha TaxID=4533 RepID=UPI001AD966F5|nr:cytosolic sulfotransferase 13-like [Oryza brachyantha]